MKIEYQIPVRLRQPHTAETNANAVLNQKRFVFLAPMHALWDVTLLRKQLGLNKLDAVATMNPFQDANRPGIEAFGNVEIYNPELCTTPQQVLERIEHALSQEFDIIAIGSKPEWSHYPEDIQKHIVKEVKENGKTIILSNLEIPELCTQQTDDAIYELPGLKAVVTSCGKGRVIKYTVDCEADSGFLLPDTENEADFERAVALFSQLVLDVQKPNVKYDEAACKLNLDWASEGTWEIRHTEDYVLLSSGKLQSGSNELELVSFPAGNYVLFCQEYTSGATYLLDFKLNGNTELWHKGDGNTELTINADCNTAADSIHWQWFDIADRLLSEATAAIPDNGRIIIPKPEGTLSVVNTLIVYTLSKGKAISRQHLEYLFEEFAPKSDFSFLVWYLMARKSWKHQLYLGHLHDNLGADAICNCSRKEEIANQAAHAQLRTVPYTTWMHKIAPGATIFNSEWQQEMAAQAEATVAAHRPYGALGYTLGDECYLDAFTAPGRFAGTIAEAEFRTYLQMIYANDLVALNTEYGTNFSTWENVNFASDRELFQNFDNPSPWIDYRLFIAAKFTGTFQELRQIIQHSHPDAFVGWDGCEQFSSYDGIDWYEFSRNMDITVVYANTELAMGNGPSNVMFNGLAAKSFSPNARLSGAFLNNINSGCGGNYAPIWLLAHGYRSIWQWHATYPDYECGAVDWELKPTINMAPVVKTLRNLRQGATALLGHAKSVYSPIAIHYSALNYHASTVESSVSNHINNLGMTKAEFWSADQLCGRTIKANSELESIFGSKSPNGHYAPACKNFLLLCRDLGHQPFMLAKQEIEAGKLSYPETKILILPFVTALSDAEVTAIEAFVHAGGTVIADYHTGLRDGHGKIRANGGALDELFGIRHIDPKVENYQQQSIIEYNFSVGGNWQHRFSDHIELIGDGCVLAAYNDGTPMAKNGIGVYGTGNSGAPVFIVNHSGAGSTLFLNFDLYNYDHLRRNNLHHNTLELFRDAFWKLAKVARFDAPRNESGNYLNIAEMTEMLDADNRYVGIFPDYSIGNLGTRHGTLRFNPHEHIYDILEHRYLGQGNIEVNYVPGKAQLYAALTSTVSNIVAESKKRKIIFNVEFADGQPHAAAVAVRIFGPDNMECGDYARLLYTADGKGDFTLPMALNDSHGEWTFEITEAFSGLKTNVKVLF